MLINTAILKHEFFTLYKANTAGTASLLVNFGLQLYFTQASRFSLCSFASSSTISPEDGLIIIALRICFRQVTSGSKRTVHLKLRVGNLGCWRIFVEGQKISVARKYWYREQKRECFYCTESQSWVSREPILGERVHFCLFSLSSRKNNPKNQN